MRSRIVHLSWFASLLAVLSPAIVAAAAPQSVILIDWAGTRRELVDRGLSNKQLPNLQAIINRGVYVKIDGQGLTGNEEAAWTQLLTGYLPKPATGSGDSQNRPIPRGATVFDRLENHFGPEKFVTVSLIGNRQTPAGFRPAVSDVWADGLSPDETVATKAVELLDKYKNEPSFFFVRFAAADGAEAQKSQDSTKSNDALTSYDRWTGRIMEKVKELGLSDKTQFYVTADRDDNQAGQGSVSHAFLATDNRAIHRDGRRQDIAPTILEAFGLDPDKIEPAMDGISLTRVDTRPPVEDLTRKPDVVYVPTPQIVVDKMLELAQVKQSDIVYDLGCGDARIPVTAAKRFGCTAFGYDIDPQRIAESLENVEKNGVGHLVTIEQRDIFTLDLSKADVVTLYLLPSLNVKLIPQLEKLKPGSRIVSHDFDMKGVTPDQVVEVTGDGSYISHTVYLWTCPLNKPDEPDEGADDGID